MLMYILDLSVFVGNCRHFVGESDLESCYAVTGCYPRGKAVASIPSTERKEVVHMTDYEMLSVIIAFGMLIVAIVALCKNSKK